MTNLLHRLGEYRPFTALLIGDFMLDQHIIGAAERLSPDAPVPILRADRFEDQPGGAANVAMCLEALRGRAVCVGVVGEDAYGRTLRDQLADAGCDADGLLVDDSRPTTVKQSLIGLAQHRHPQKMFRVDIESNDPLSDEMVDRLLAVIDRRLDDADIVLLEDYHKGVCTPRLCRAVIERCRARGIDVLVDPAAIDDYSKYRGATAVTPNRSEAERAAAMPTPADPEAIRKVGLGRRLLDDLELDAVVLTLDRHGAWLEVRGGESSLVPTVARNVYDVSGAGDVVLAALAGARANGFDWFDAVRFANAAAGLEVEVFGVRPIPLAAVRREIMNITRRANGKHRTLDELRVELAVHREAEQTVVFTNGCFDVIHAGHLEYLQQARQLGDVLVVAINADEQVRALKGDGRPVYSEQERLAFLSALPFVDYVIVFTEPTPEPLLDALKPDILAKGGDYTIDQVVGRDIVEQYGGRVEVLAERPGLGSTQVIERFVRAYGSAESPEP